MIDINSIRLSNSDKGLSSSFIALLKINALAEPFNEGADHLEKIVDKLMKKPYSWYDIHDAFSSYGHSPICLRNSSELKDLFVNISNNKRHYACHIKPEYVHEIRKQVASNPNELKIIINELQSRYEWLRKYFSDHNETEYVYYILTIAKLYANEPLTEDQVHRLVLSTEGRFSDAVKIHLLSAFEDKDFVDNLSSHNRQMLAYEGSALSAKNLIEDAPFYDLLNDVSKDSDCPPPIYEYFKLGLTDRCAGVPELEAIDSFFRGDFQKSKKAVLEFRKNWKKVHSNYNIPYEFKLILNYSRARLNEDIATMKKEMEGLLYKGIGNVPFENLLVAVCVLDYYYRQMGQKNSQVKDYINNYELFISQLQSNYSFLLITLMTATLANNEDKSARASTGNDEALKSALCGIYTHFPYLAKLLYPTISGYAENDFLPELKNDEFIDFTRKETSKEIWKTKLDSISDILKIKNLKAPSGRAKSKKAESNIQKHLVWLFENNDRASVVDDYDYIVHPFAATVDIKTGELEDVGDPYEIKNFFNTKSAKHSFITDQDRAIASNFEKTQFGYRNSFIYYFKSSRTLPFMMNHPYIYFYEETPTSHRYIHLNTEERNVAILVEQKGDKLKLSLEYGTHGSGNVFYSVDTKEKKLKMYQISNVHKEIFSVLGRNGTEFPKSALSEIAALGRSTDIELRYNLESEAVKGQVKPIVFLEATGRSFKVKLRVKPVNDNSCPLKIPGLGEESVVISYDKSKTPVVANRDLKAERSAADALIHNIPKISELYEEDDYFYSTDDPQDILDLLSQIKENSENYDIQWAEGKKFYVNSGISSSSFKLSGDLNEKGYLEISGNVELSEGRYISLKALIKSIGSSKGNYIQIDEENYVAITSELKKRLEKIHALTTEGKKDTLITNPLTVSSMSELLEDLNCKFGSDVKELIRKRDEAMSYEAKLPKTLAADLRSYQEEGFTWLCRLAKWGVGGVLADDMGLGKTVQTISAMLTLAAKGPAMVVAPTSVCPNWEREINRFAPTLSVKRLKESDNRKETVESMKAGEVLIVSYGLFAIESEILSSVQWQMVVYDEAQALKNSMTRRAKTACLIPSAMRLALTGTPIENNLDDLWSIFNIINPGLLGSKTEFHKRFAMIKEDKNCSRTLKLLISPFILRRLKSDVLDDLPPRTEQVITVEPSEREKELYEALRLSTIEDLEKNRLEINKSGQRRLQILSALTRLRQFCCDPAIADQTLKTGASSKTQAFSELLDEAISGGHRLLVFSQFVGYLSVIRQLLEEKKISYRYLDGSTPEKARALAISEFQAGEGDVFLISLKAGGQGLNLTGADYVVHLDPWWNPAVEDQATDRAYRIGQTRPVNVIRLVIKNSLEEKILELHAKKRELAADFLGGTADVAAEAMKLSEQELLDLLN